MSFNTFSRDIGVLLVSDATKKESACLAGIRGIDLLTFFQIISPDISQKESLRPGITDSICLPFKIE